MNAPDERNRRRSERVVLRVRVVVTMQGGNCTNEVAQTVVVNAHGGLLDIGREIAPGTRILLSNPRTQMTEGCRVVRVERVSEGHYSIAFEFERPAPTFWPVIFPPSDWKPVES